MYVGCTYGITCKPFDTESYRQEKLDLLADFCIHPTESELTHLNTLVTPRQIDSFVKAILNKYWA